MEYPDSHDLNFSNRLVRTRMPGGVAGARLTAAPYADQAKDEAARQWYASWEFEASPTDPYHLFLMLKDLKALLA